MSEHNNVSNTRAYLGDGVYVEFDGCGLWLLANSHDQPTERIYLEPQVLEALIEFLHETAKGERCDRAT